MIKALIVTYIFATHETKFIIFNDYVLKEYFYKNDSIKAISNIKYEIFDLKNNNIYSIPVNLESRISRSSSNTFGNWQIGSKTIIKTERTRIKQGRYNCLKVTEIQIIKTPLGTIQAKKIYYFAKFKKYLQDLSTNAIIFLGFTNNTYDPYRFRIREYIENDGMSPITIIQVKLNYQMVDRNMLDYLLTLPEKNN